MYYPAVKILLPSFLISLAWIAAGQAKAQPAPLAQPTIRLADIANSSVMALPDMMADPMPTANSVLGSAVSLADLVRQGLQQSPQLRQSEAQVDAARSGRKLARADLLSNFSVRYAAGPENSRAPGQTTSHHRRDVGTVRLTQPLFNASLTHEWQSSQQVESAAQRRLQAAKDNVTLSVVRATIDLSAARLVLDFSNVQLAHLQNILDYLEQRAAAGASSVSDLERAKSRVFTARQTRMEQQAAYRNAFNELRRLTQQAPTAIRLPSMVDFPALQAEGTTLQALAIQNNPDILAAELDVRAQEKRVKAEWSKYKPEIGVSLEYDDSRNVRGINGPNHDVRALVVANWAVSLGGKEWHQAEQAMAEMRQKEARLEDEKQRLLQTLESDATLFESAVFRVATAQLEQEAAGKVIAAVEAQLSSGRLGSLLEALDASERFFASRQRLVQAIAQQLKAHAQLLARVGQLGDLQR
jgi:outer membrane protein, adhesin transport system